MKKNKKQPKCKWEGKHNTKFCLSPNELGDNCEGYNCNYYEPTDK